MITRINRTKEDLNMPRPVEDEILPHTDLDLVLLDSPAVEPLWGELETIKIDSAVFSDNFDITDYELEKMLRAIVSGDGIMVLDIVKQVLGRGLKDDVAIYERVHKKQVSYEYPDVL